MSTFSAASEAQRDALAHLVAAGGEVDISRLQPELDLAGVRRLNLYGVPLLQLFDRGLVMFTGYGHKVAITTMGRALAKERAA